MIGAGLHVWLLVFDSSKAAVQPVKDEKIIMAVGSSTHRARRPAYVEHDLDSEVGRPHWKIVRVRNLILWRSWKMTLWFLPITT